MILKEKALLFGRNKSLVGILTEPPRGTETRGRPGVLLLNSGVLHRVGPNGMYVAIARALAAQGFPVLRFDFSGIGDSEPRKDAVTGDEAVLEETREAMDALTAAKGVRRFVLMGLCSGADNSFHVARADERVVGAVMLDGFAYRTWGFTRRYWMERLRSGRAWRRLAANPLTLLAQVRKLMQRDTAEPAGDGAPEAMYVRAFPPKHEAMADCAAMIERRVELCFIHSAGQYLFYNYRRQFDDAFRGLDYRGRVHVEYFPEANHTFTRLSHRQALVEAIVRWSARVIAPDDVNAAQPKPAAAHAVVAPAT
jgi:pimeloyl-ACP methyl ester carboxylesterase